MEVSVAANLRLGSAPFSNEGEPPVVLVIIISHGATSSLFRWDTRGGDVVISRINNAESDVFLREGESFRFILLFYSFAQIPPSQIISGLQ